MEKFMIFIKGKDVVPIRLDDADFGGIAQSLIKQDFLISPIQVMAGNSLLATNKYKRALTMYISLQLKELTSPILI
ncbi:hypothetical protein SPARK1531C2_04917 [Klebsiella grimontii]|nr:hypothetical protein SPARK1531C2_04917 [Klebsiella grimontii]